MNSELVEIEVMGKKYNIRIVPERHGEIKETADHLNKIIADFRVKYKITDKQDLITMAALHLINEINQNQQNTSKALVDKISVMNNSIEASISLQ